MLVQFGELTADTIDTHGFVCTVGTLDEAAVGQITVGIRITDAPVELIGIKRMFAGKLRVVCSTAGIVVFHIIDIIGLGVESGTFRIAVFGYLIENVLKFITVTAVSRLKGEIQHSAQTHIITVLVICCFAQEYGFVIGCIVRTVKVIPHIQIRFISITVIYGCQHTIGTSALGFPFMVVRQIYFKVSDRLYGL